MEPLTRVVALGAILVTAKYFQKKFKLPPVPIRLPTIALLATLINAYLPNAIEASVNSNWKNAGIELTQSYAYLQITVWIGLDLPSKIRWWPKPAKILTDLFKLTAGAVITLIILDRAANINVVGLVTTSAVLTAVIGLAAQEALKDLFAGIMLRIECPFSEGDYLEASDTCNGWVEALTLLSTHMRDEYGGLITLPNNLVWQHKMRKLPPAGPACREIYIDLDREFPPNEATELLTKIAINCNLVLDNPPPQAIVYSYNNHAVTYELEVWQKDPSDVGYDEVRGELLGQLWYALERIGQRIPYSVQEFKKRHGPSEPEVILEQSLETKIKVISLNPLFQELDDNEISSIAELSRLIRFSKNEHIVSEDETGYTLYQIVRGTVAILKKGKDGEQQEITQLSEPAFFGEMSVFNEEPRSATVKALCECILLEIEQDDLRPTLENKPKTVEKLATIINERRSALSNMNPKTTTKKMNELLRKMRSIFL